MLPYTVCQCTLCPPMFVGQFSSIRNLTESTYTKLLKSRHVNFRPYLERTLTKMCIGVLTGAQKPPLTEVQRGRAPRHVLRFEHFPWDGISRSCYHRHRHAYACGLSINWVDQGVVYPFDYPAYSKPSLDNEVLLFWYERYWECSLLIVLGSTQNIIMSVDLLLLLLPVHNYGDLGIWVPYNYIGYWV